MNTTTWQGVLALPVSPTRDHIRGPVNAPVTLVEYGDYECPYCGAAHLVVNELLARSGDDLRFVFRNFPLVNIHLRAEQAAEAAEAAGAQGKFWEMHDVLYENQQRLEPPHLIAYAEELELDTERFASELAQRAYAQRVMEDFVSGARSGVHGTPTFFINGVRHDSSWDLPHLLAAVERAAAARVRA
jgi:protein-disulfide isomerase